MDGKTFLATLLAHEKTNPYALAQRLKKPSLQSLIKRFLDGYTKAPRWDNLAPVAEYFGVGVEAFYTPSLAQKIVDERGLRVVNDVKEPDEEYRASTLANPPVPIKQVSALSITDLVVALGATLEPFDLSARKAVASLLQDVAMHPADAELFAGRIARLLEAPGKGHPRKSIVSR